ncbi:MAG TPA: hypothetical protein VFB12_10150 [Ktedonobacteraceae bacterium]|nr:hypothetical protein [Ktedonobacteraceae bacterium]
MEPELVQRLHNSTKEQLVLLLQELGRRHTPLVGEIAEILDSLAQTAQDDNENAQEKEQAAFNADDLVIRRPLPQSVLSTHDLHAYQQRLEGYPALLDQGGAPQAIFDDLISILQEVETRADRLEQRYHLQALDIYALVLDTRLATRNPALTSIFDRGIDEFMPMLATLLVETSSTVELDTSIVAPLLSANTRQRWLERLLTLWLKRLDAYHTEENLPEVILEVAWSEDVSVLRNLIQDELHQQRHKDHSNIVDFSHQSRIRILEKFLKELPLI